MPHSNSTKARLTFYFTCVFGIMVVCLAVASYSVFRNQAYSELDGPLHVAAGATAISTAHELGEHREKSDGEADLQSILEISSHSELPETQILIREGERNVAYKAARGQSPQLSTMRNSQILSANSVAGLRVATAEIEVPKFHARYVSSPPNAPT